ncbi:hypothetical protein E2562_018456 [Oryza meyeriana var. granulata]|uniref:Uncharacterized protein n=1 Tax=Oryza meyeriana var. granulata TaxID=110450 RepID=A0A6G1EME1_9ORYZ|nr:hypothetical protein E2562_018456 [Oryza meyeriana var. granulata]
MGQHHHRVGVLVLHTDTWTVLQWVASHATGQGRSSLTPVGALSFARGTVLVVVEWGRGELPPKAAQQQGSTMMANASVVCPAGRRRDYL